MEKTIYEITWAVGCNLSDINGDSSFKSQQEAIEVAVKHKYDPRMFNKNMSDENVEYWKNQTYTITKKTVIEEVVAII